MALMSFLVRKNMPISMTGCCLVGSVAPLRLVFLALYGGCFGTLVWGRRVALDIAALILGVLR